MDISTLLLPGAQKLGQAMLGDAWNLTRDAIARRWGRGDRAAAEAAATELDDSRENALAVSVQLGCPHACRFQHRQGPEVFPVI